MAFVRFAEKAHSICGRDDDAATVCQKLFDKDGERWSVYETELAEEESHIAGAMYQKLGRYYIDAVWFVRFTGDDFEGLVEIKPSKGETGVGAVDELHRELITDYEKLTSAVGRMLDALKLGQDRLRYVSISQVTARLQEFLGSDDTEVTGAVRKYSERALKKK